MKKKLSSKRARRAPKTLLRVPDLDYAKAAVPNSLTSEDEFAIGYPVPTTPALWTTPPPSSRVPGIFGEELEVGQHCHRTADAQHRAFEMKTG
jgi:hypothetical protein